LLTEKGVGRSGRYVRVQLPGDNYLSLAEVEVMAGTGPGPGVKWLVQDHLGSTRMVVDWSGSLGGIRRHDFAPFGEEIGAGIGIRSASNGYEVDTVRQKYTAHERDSETGLDYFGARYYTNLQGRFTSPDPLLSSGRPANPQSWNRYAYVWNNPLRLIDPNGLDVYDNRFNDPPDQVEEDPDGPDPQDQDGKRLNVQEQGVVKSVGAAAGCLGNPICIILSLLIDPPKVGGDLDDPSSGQGPTARETLGDEANGVAMAILIPGGRLGRFGKNIGEKALEDLAREQLEKRFIVTLGRDITKTEAMADFIAVAKSGKSAVVQEVTTGANKSISTIRAQLEGGIDHLIKQGFKGEIKPIVRVTDRRLFSTLQKELTSVRGRGVKIIHEGQ
jgi:RHS repeat-associated protein